MENIAGSLGVKITADASGVKRGLKETSRNLNKVERQLNHQQRSWKSWSIQSVAATVAIGMAVGATARKIVEYGDAFQNLTNKLKITTTSQAELTDITSKMFDMAIRNRSAIEGTVDLYTKLHRSTKELGMSSGELIDITDTIQKAFIIGGASSREMEGAVRQLGQALASGALRGEEFNSVSEQAPVIMEAVKEATGKSAAELRKLAAEGAISTELLIKSLELYRQKAVDTYAQTEATFSQNMQNARSELIKWVGANETLKDILKGVGEGMHSLAKNIDMVVIAVGALATAYAGALLQSMANSNAQSAIMLSLSGKKVAAMRAETAETARSAVATAEAVKHELFLARAKEQGAIASAKKAIGTKSEHASLKALNVATQERLVLERAVVATSTASGLAQGKNIVLTNASTFALWRQNAALTARNFLTGNWITLAALAGYGVYQWATSESDLEKETRFTNDQIKRRIELMGKMSDNNLATNLKVLSDAESRYSQESLQNQKAIAKAKKDVANAGLLDFEPSERLKKLKEEELRIAKDLNRTTILRVDAQKKVAERTKEQVKKDKEEAKLAYILEEGNAKKIIEAWNKKSKSKIELAKDEKDAALDALDKIKIANTKRAEEDIKVDSELKARLLEIQSNHEIERGKIIAESQARIDKIKENSQESKEARDIQKRLEKIKESAKSELQIEEENWAKKKALMTAQWGEKSQMDEAQRAVYEETERQHQERIRNIKMGADGDDFLASLEERWATEQELRQQQYDAELIQLQTLYGAKYAEDVNYLEKKKKLDKEYNDEKAAIDARANHVEMQGKLALAGDMINIAKNFSGRSKKLQKAVFIAEKAVAMGRAIAAMNLGIALANLQPYPLNIAAAAKAKLIGGIGIAGIAASAIGGGSRGSPSIGGSSSVGSSSSSGGSFGSQNQQPTAPRNISINLTGGSMFSADQVRELIGEINSQIGDGVTLNTGG